MISHVTRPFRLSLALPSLISAAFLPVSPPMKAQTAPIAVNPILPGPKPPDAPSEWKGILGIYGSGKDALILLESDQQLYLSDEKKSRPALLYFLKGRKLTAEIRFSKDSVLARSDTE